MRQTVVVIGDEAGFGALVDSSSDEDEAKSAARAADKWWMRESVTGVGRGVSVVESLHVGEDWRRRVNEEA